MTSTRSIRLTWLAIRYSLAPHAPAGSVAGRDSSPAIRLRALFTDLERQHGRSAELALYLPGVHPLAAPAIMFRLKRTGWSACRVTVTPAGLHLTARR